MKTPKMIELERQRLDLIADARARRDQKERGPREGRCARSTAR
jgi:hypothetical protein